MATANFSAQRTSHETQSAIIASISVSRATGNGSPGILAFFGTLPRVQPHANFTVLLQRQQCKPLTMSGVKFRKFCLKLLLR